MSYCEIPEFYHETFPKAKKVHRCVECAAPIEVGEEHLYYRLKFDGEFYAERQHMLCRKACMFIKDEFQQGKCIAFGELHEYWRDYSSSRDEMGNKFRRIMAGIRWRERKHLVTQKRINGVLMRRKWGEPNWSVVV